VLYWIWHRSGVKMDIIKLIEKYINEQQSEHLKKLKIQDHLLSEKRGFTYSELTAGKDPDDGRQFKGMDDWLRVAVEYAMNGKYKEALKVVANCEKEMKKFKTWLKKQS